MKFQFREFNNVRYARGADAVRMVVVQNDGSSIPLNMNKDDIRNNVRDFGPHIGLLKAGGHYGLSLEALLKIWNDAGRKGLFTPEEPTRDRYGLYTHPDFPNDVASSVLEDWLKKIGMQLRFVMLEDDHREESEDVRQRWSDGDSDYLAWNPEKPEGEGWFIGTIYDSEDGPVCIWLRWKPAAVQDAPQRVTRVNSGFGVRSALEATNNDNSPTSDKEDV